MLSLIQLLPLLPLVLSSNHNLIARQNSEEDYLTSVCSPNITAETNPVPPCIEIVAIEEGCAPNGTDPIDYIAHQQCMCNGGFFDNWIGCLDCQYVHGGRSPQLTSAFHTIITSASNSLCTGTPTASFADIFSAIQESVNPGDATATGLKDQFPSQTAVSLYFTPTGAQGLGAITGSATTATRTGGAGGGDETSSSGGAAAMTTGGSTSPGATGTGGAASGSSSSSSAGAAKQTGMGILALAGAALVAAV